MKKKRDSKKSKVSEVAAIPEEQGELQMILDRLSVQNPEGESFHNYLESLGRMLKGRENFTLALLDRLSRKPTPAGFQVFLKFKDIFEESGNRRAARQAGYRFQQKGFGVDEKDQPRKKVVLVPREERRILSHLLPFEGTFGFVTALIPAEGYPSPMALTVFAEDEFQTLYARVTESSYNAYRDYLRKVSREVPETRICEVPIGHVARLVFELQELSGRAESFLELEKAKELLKPYHDLSKPPYVHELLPRAEDPVAAIQEVQPDELMGRIDLSWLLFSKEELLPFHEELAAMRDNLLILPPDMERERTQSLFERAANSLCTGRMRRFYIRFFEEQALVFQLSGMEESARAAWIVAQHLASDVNPSDNPVVFRMTVLSLQEHWPEEDIAEDEERVPYRKTESGLLLLR